MTPEEKSPQEALRTAFSSVRLDPDTRARHLRTVRHRAASLPPPTPTPAGAPRLRGLRLRLAAVASAALLTLGGGAGVAVAADSLPGDTLYPVKVAVEQLQLRLASGPDAAVQRGLELAERRLDELAALQELRRDEHIAVGLARFEEHMAAAEQLAAGEAGLEADVLGAQARAFERLTELLAGDLPEQAADRAREALEAARARIGPPEADSVSPAEAPRRPTQPTPPPHAERPVDPGPPAQTPAETRRQDGERRPERPTQPDPEARPGGGTPPPSPGSRAPRGPRS